jgi:trigger factor
MKTELTDVTATRKTLAIEIPSEVVDAEISRVASGYTKQARIPGFRPGKVPAAIVRQRFKEQILHDVMHGLIPRAVEAALQERGLEPVDTPDIRDVSINEGQPLTFTAAVETVPPFDPGDLSSLEVRRPAETVREEDVDRALEQLRARAATFQVVEDRPIGAGDTAVLDIERTQAAFEPDRHEGVTVEIGAPVNPPGFDAELVGLGVGDAKTFRIRFPDDYAVREMAGADVTYAVTVRDIRRRVLSDLDDEFAKDLGDFASLAALRDRVRADLEREARERAARQMRAQVVSQLASRMGFEPPRPLVDREIDRRVEELARQLVRQHVDPRQSGIDWRQLREAQREPARVAVAGALALDEIARRERLTVSPGEVDREIERVAAAAGRTAAAVRAQLEKEGGLGRLEAGLRREKAVDFALSRARMSTD